MLLFAVPHLRIPLVPAPARRAAIVLIAAAFAALSLIATPSMAGQDPRRPGPANGAPVPGGGPGPAGAPGAPGAAAPAAPSPIPAGPPKPGDLLLLFAAADSLDAFRTAIRPVATGWQIQEDAGALTEKNGGVLFACLPVFDVAEPPVSATVIVDAVKRMLGRRGGHYLQTQAAMDMADGLPTAAASNSSVTSSPTNAATAPAAVDGTWLFTKPSGLIVTTVKPQKDAAFLLLLGTLRTALQKSPRAVRQEQARHWRVVKVTSTQQGGATTYVSLLDRTVPEVNYAWSSIFADALKGDDLLRAYAEYGDTVASMTVFDLTPLPR